MGRPRARPPRGRRGAPAAARRAAAAQRGPEGVVFRSVANKELRGRGAVVARRRKGWRVVIADEAVEEACRLRGRAGRRVGCDQQTARRRGGRRRTRPWRRSSARASSRNWRTVASAAAEPPPNGAAAPSSAPRSVGGSSSGFIACVAAAAPSAAPSAASGCAAHSWTVAGGSAMFAPHWSSEHAKPMFGFTVGRIARTASSASS